MIWKFALLVPREVLIEHITELIEDQLDIVDPLGDEEFWSSPTPCPALLHTNRESRELSLQSLRLGVRGSRWLRSLYDKMGFPLSAEESSGQLQRGIYFNPDVDTICCHIEDITDLESEDWEHIQSLKIVLRRFGYTPPVTRNGAEMGRREVNLGKVYLRLLRRELVQVVGKAPRMTLSDEVGDETSHYELELINSMEEYESRCQQDMDGLQVNGITILRSTIRANGQSSLH